MSTDRTKAQDIRLGNDSASAASQNAALKGASLAFGKPPVKPKPKPNTYSGTNGALAAATKVGTGGNGPPQSPNRLTTMTGPPSHKKTLSSSSATSLVGGGLRAGTPERNRQGQFKSQYGGSDGYGQPADASDSSKSHSFLAANIAASRSASTSPSRTDDQNSNSMNRTLRKLASFEQRPSSMRSGSVDSDPVLDTRSIPPTTSLIGMFEHTENPSNVSNRPLIKRSTTSASGKSPLRHPSPSPIPARRQTPSPLSVANRQPSPSPVPKPKPKPKPKAVISNAPLVQSNEIPKSPEPLQPPPSKTKKARAQPPLQAPKPMHVSATPEATNNEPTDGYESSADSFVSASDYQPTQPSFRAALTEQKRRMASASATSVNSSAAIDSLANAIVASSLASSRAASPSRSLTRGLLPPPPPPTRRNGHHLFHNSKELSRTPSPVKQGLRTTLRKPNPKEEIDEGEKRRGKKNLVKKHPNKHHEGDRKRWRDEVTERERKRYEAVWASNRGLYTGNSPGAEYTVCNLLVRDIWSRSRLSSDVLEEVYGLVDRSGGGTLEKEEFVVGLWLIDQRLKGRKLPIRVSESVWKSVGAMNGIKIRKIGRG